MKNILKTRNGFTLVELLGAVVIAAILMSASVIAYTRYIESSKRKAYVVLVKSAANAAESYTMDYPNTESVTIRDLYEKQYLEYPRDPANKETMCDGEVRITKTNATSDKLAKNTYTVILCCTNYNYTYDGNGKNPVKNDTCMMS